MQIDWFTLGAQVVNFLILVALLRYFLYGRVVEAMDRREARIAARLKEAEERQAEAGREAETLHREREEFERRRDELLEEAEAEAEAYRRELVREARADVDRLQARWMEKVRRERTDFLDDLRRQIGGRFRDAVDDALDDLAGADLEARVVEVFLQRLKALDDSTRHTLAGAIREEDGKVLVESAFELPEETRRRIMGAVREEIEPSASPTFEVSPDLVSGLRLRAAGRQLGWSLRDYLEELERDVSGALEARFRRERAPSKAVKEAE